MELAAAQFVPYFGKNKVSYDTFAWRVYKSPHFEVYYYPEFEQHLAKFGLKYSDGPHLKENGSGFAFIDAPEGYEIELIQRAKEAGTTAEY